MSRGLGRIQRECLRVIEEYEAAGHKPTTFNIVAQVYQIERDRHGNRMCNDAQHTATKRALASLRRKGLVSGQQDTAVFPSGEKHFPHADPATRRALRCCYWTRAISPDAPGARL